MEKDIKDTEVMEKIESEAIEAEAAEAEKVEFVEAAGDTAKTVEFEEIPGAAADTAAEKKPEAKDKKEKKKSEWASKPVTGKVLAIALGIAVLVNAALTAGISAIFANNNKSKMPENGRPGSEMMDGQGGQNDQGNGQMTPPGDSNGGPQGNQGQGQSQQQSSGPSIGITVSTGDSGVVIAQVTGDNAKTAGFQEGDVILKIDGTAVSSGDELVSAVKSHSAGDTVTLTIDRDGQQMEIKTVLE